MVTVIITFGIILFVVFIMSIGLILGRKPISGGSCCDGARQNAECAGCEKYEKSGCPPQSSVYPRRDSADAVQGIEI
jgi:hypothetical protein